MSKKVVIGITVGVVLLGCLGLCGIGGLFVYKLVGNMTVDKQTYDSIQPGQSELIVKNELPGKDAEMLESEVYEAADSSKSAMPIGASCTHYLAALPDQSGERTVVYRFCFKEGKLIEKRMLETVS